MMVDFWREYTCVVPRGWCDLLGASCPSEETSAIVIIGEVPLCWMWLAKSWIEFS